VIAVSHPWWPHVFSFPRFLDPINWFWNSTKGYAFTSSGLQLTIPLGIALWVFKHNCHEHRCLRLSWHPDGTGHPVCKRHHSEHPSEGFVRNVLKRLGLRAPTDGPVRFHYRNPSD
jgi:hypothetical protein